MRSDSIKLGAVISYASVFLSIAITFFYTPWMIRQIGVPDYGLYNLVVTFISYFVIDFGLSYTVTRFIAKYRAEGEEQKIENLMGLIFKVYIIIDAIIFIVLFILYFFLTNIFLGLSPEEIQTLKLLYVYAGVFSVMSFVFQPMNGAMMAYEYFVESKMLDMFHRVGTVLLIVVCLLLNGGVYWLVIVNGAVGLTISIVRYVLFKHKSGIRINWSYFDCSVMKDLLTFSWWVFLINMAQRLRLSFAPTVLGIFSNSEQISIFSLGMQIEGMVWVLSTALNGLFLPEVTRLSHNNSKTEIMNLMIKVGRIQLYIITLIFFGFIIFGKEFLSLWVGDTFSNSYYVVLMLIGTNMITLTQSIASDMIYAENKVQYTSKLIIITSAMAFLGSIFLAPKFGAVGCAISFFAALLVYVVLINIFYKKELNLDIALFFNSCHRKVLPVLSVLALLFYIIKCFLPISTWYSLFIYILVFVMIYFTIAYLFVFNQEEKNLINKIIVRS